MLAVFTRKLEMNDLNDFFEKSAPEYFFRRKKKRVGSGQEGWKLSVVSRSTVWCRSDLQLDGRKVFLAESTR